MNKRSLLLAIGTLGLFAVTAAANPQLEALRLDHTNQLHYLRHERDLANKQARADHRLTIERLNCAIRDTRYLCPPERSVAIRQITYQRKVENRLFRDRIVGIQATYSAAIRHAKLDYQLAVRETRVALLPCGCPVNHCTCVAASPIATTVVPPWAIRTNVVPITVLVPESTSVYATERVVVPQEPTPATRIEPDTLPHPVGPDIDDGAYGSGHRRPVARMIMSLLARL